MNLQEFEAFFDDTILKRGFDYYKSGQVESLELDENTWIAEVSGSDDYEVTVTLLDDGEIIETTCNCPYDFGMYCKHQAAVLYALRDQKNTNSSPKEPKRKESLESILGKLDKQTLLSIMLELANRDRRIKKELLLRCSEKSDAVQYARDVIKTSIKSASHHGFVEYQDTDRAIDGVDTVMKMANDLVATGDVFAAASLYIVILEEMVDLLDNCDDSSGHVGDVICETIENLNESFSLNSLEEKKAETLFNMIFAHATNQMYNGWSDWRMEILSGLVPFCQNHANREKLELYLSGKQSSSTNDWRNQYEVKEKQALQLQIIRTFDGDAAAKEYLERNVDNSDFRRIVVENAISDGDFEKALMMCLEGEKSDESYPGLVSKWKHFRYEIYEKKSDIAAQKNLARELLAQGDFTYFAKLKALYEESQWQAILPEIVEEARNSNYQKTYIEILIHENLKPQLLDHCKNNFLTSEKLFSHLLPEYEEDVDDLFIKLIRHHAAKAGDRGQYRHVCDLIRHYKKTCGKSTDTIRDEIAAKNPRRPAFLDELSKV